MDKLYFQNVVISLAWGIALVGMFYLGSRDKKCILIKAPNPNNIKGKVFLYNQNCYKYDTYAVSCDSKKNIISH